MEGEQKSIFYRSDHFISVSELPGANRSYSHKAQLIPIAILSHSYLPFVTEVELSSVLQVSFAEFIRNGIRR